MKKINQSISKKYPPVKLFLEDLEGIVELFEQHQIKYSLATEKYSYDNLKELIENEKKIKSLEIKSTNPYVTIQLATYETSLYCSSDDLLSMGLFHGIDKILKRKIRIIYPKGSAFALLLTSLVFGWFVDTLVKHIYLTPVILIYIIYVANFLWVHNYRHSLIYLTF